MLERLLCVADSREEGRSGREMDLARGGGVADEEGVRGDGVREGSLWREEVGVLWQGSRLQIYL